MSETFNSPPFQIVPNNDGTYSVTITPFSSGGGGSVPAIPVPLPVTPAGPFLMTLDPNSATLLQSNAINRSFVPVTDTAVVYNVNQVIGGIVEVQNMATRVAGGGVLNTLSIVNASTDAIGKLTPITFHFFNADPGAIADHGDFTGIDMTKWIGSVAVNTSDYDTYTSFTLVSKNGQAFSYQPSASSLWVAPVCKVASAQFTTTSDLTVVLGTLQD